MCEIVVNDLFDEIINENNRLCNQLVFAMKCLDVLQTFETFIRKVMTFKTIIINEQQLSSQDIQTLDQLDNQLTDVLTQLKQRSAQSVKSYEKQLISGKADQMSGKELVNKSRVNINNQLTVSPKVISIKVLKLPTINDSIKSRQQSDENERQTQQMTDNSHEKPFPCYVINCDYKSCDIPGLISHLKTNHSITSIQCTHEGCTQLFGDQHDLNRHLQLKHKTINKNVKKSIDKITNKSQITRKSQKINRLVTNQMNINNTDNEVKTQLDCIKKKFNCFAENCYYNCLNVNELANHLKIRHSITNYIQCTFDGCQQLFVDEKQLKSHVSDEHKIYDSSLIVIPNDCNKRQKSKTINPFDCKQLFKCDYKDCGEMLKTYFQFDKHMKCHPIGESQSLETHLIKQKYKINRQYRCNYNGCDRVFKFNNSLITHKITHNMKGSKLYRCLRPECEYKSYFSCAFKRHQLIHSDVRDYPCDYPGCQYRAKEMQIITKHKKIRHFTNEKNYRCSWSGCAKQFKTADTLRNHTRFKHLIAEEDRKKFRCDYDGCDRVFNSKWNLQYHTISVHEKQAKIYQCSWPGCDYTTKHYVSLGQHERIHKPMKDIRCDYDGCNFTTKYSSHLKCHRDIHSTEPKYRCSWPDCNKQFKTLAVFKSHEVIHSEPKYVCDWKDCQFRTYWSYNLKSHLNRKHLKKLLK
ncbi:zinc finger protein 616-like [Oppia nitens]|uniref:zinc finger protein 616-like n=1 Tax=Oppia nitens TaxID=1686743 RepID=UPI0023DC81A5|nr:zinc finger protein 616-like [Oppia nitens]